MLLLRRRGALRLRRSAGRTRIRARRYGRALPGSRQRCAPVPCLWVDRVRRGPANQDGQISAKTMRASSPRPSPVSNGQMRAWSAQRGSSCSSRTTGMPVSTWPPTAPAPNSFQQGCAPTIQVSTSRFSRRPPASCRRWCLLLRNALCICPGRPQNGNTLPETRSFSCAATLNRLLRLRSSSVISRAISSQTARHGGPSSLSRAAKPEG